MRRYGLCSFLLISFFVRADNDAVDEWFDIPPSDRELYISYGWGNDGERSQSLIYSTPLLYRSELSIGVNQSEQFANRDLGFEKAEGEGTQISLSSDPYADFVFSLGYERYEHASHYQAEDYWASLALHTKAWRTELRYSNGDITLSPNREVSVFSDAFAELDLLEAERQGMGLGIAYSATSWGAQFYFNDYSVTRKSTLENSDLRTLLENLSEAERQQLRRLILFGETNRASSIMRIQTGRADQFYGHQLNQFADEEYGVDWYTFLSDYTISAGLVRSKNRATRNISNTTYLSTEIPLFMRCFGMVLLSRANSDDYSDTYAEIGFGIRW